ncbi:MAG: esterase family protein [Muribaculaceae bacterium]|nr:esterase family protein [Muribaculaceae bacterium]
MKRYLLILSLFVVLMSGALPAEAQNLTGLGLPQADTVKIHSAKMARDITTVVIVPEQYFAPEKLANRFPVLYLLHGASGCYNNWPKIANLDAIASQYSMIIVCPDGQDSWYFDSPIDPAFQFETFISKELVEYIDRNYRTVADRSTRAITGLSMGGHGALWNAWRHPDVFGSCGSMSGGVDIVPFPGRWNIDKRLGNYDDNKDVWAAHSVINLVPALKKGQNIIIDDGNEDFFLEVNLNLHKALQQHGIAHDFIVRPGNHSWDYWVNALDYQVLFFHKAFTHANM